MAVRALSSSLKTLAICDVVAGSRRPMRLADVVQATGDPRGAVYQRLKTLVEAGFLEQCPEGRFRLGLRFHSYAARALEQASLGDRSSEILQGVVADSGETASLSIVEGTGVIIVNRIESDQVLRADLRVGARLELGGSASGAVAVAYATPEAIERWRSRGLGLPPQRALDEIRTRGFAVHKPVKEQQIAAVAAPVLDLTGHCVAILAVSGPPTRFNYQRCATVAVAAARELSKGFGASCV